MHAICTFGCFVRKASSPVSCTPFRNLATPTFISYPSARQIIPRAEDDFPLPLPVNKTITPLSMLACSMRESIYSFLRCMRALY